MILPNLRSLPLSFVGAMVIGRWLPVPLPAQNGGLNSPIEVDHCRVAEAVLFAFDDHSIPSSHNLQLAMETPEKYAGNPVVPLGALGEPDEWQMRYYGTVIRQEGKFKMWYIAAAREGFVTEMGGGLTAARGDLIDWRGWRFAYAESADGVHWAKPNLGLVEFRGSRQNNLIQLPEGFRGYHDLVIYESSELDPRRRFKMMARITQFGDYSVSKAIAAGGAFVPLYSADGLRWRVADELTTENKKAISPKFHLVTNFEGTGLYKWEGMYYLTGQSFSRPPSIAAMAPYGRHIEIFRSPDLLHWSETETMGFARQGQFHRPSGRLTEENGPIDNEQTHAGVSVWPRGNVLIGLTGFWHGAKEWRDVTHDLGFLISNDGLHYREPQPDFIFTRVGQDGRDWDTGALSQGDGFENVGDKTYIWYGQEDQREGGRTGTSWKREGGVGLLTLPRDRFGSLFVRDPDYDGSLVTSEVQAAQPVKLWLNADGLGPDSQLRVELLDRAERPLRGYSEESAAVLTQSGLRIPVAWNATKQISVTPQPFKIQVRFEGPERNAIRLYALYIEASQ